MMIPWMYLNKEAASINALKDYASMEQIIESYADDLTESSEFLTSPHSAGITTVPKKGSGNIRSTERRMADAIDRIDVVKERYAKALEYMAWFRPAWDALDEPEQQLLEEFYLEEGKTRAEIVKSLCEKMFCEKSSVYRAKEKALGHLTLLLYGK